MGYLERGEWHAQDEFPKDERGRFTRNDAAFRGWIPELEPGRYHLVLAHACPWCHRVAIARQLAGLQDAVSVSYVHPLMLDEGWQFTESHPDTGIGARFAREYYVRADPDHTGRVTVPILWDRHRATIVNNESSDILRMFCPDLYPSGLRSQIDEINALVYPQVNNGVYRCGFAGTQEAYEEAFAELFSALDTLEARLTGERWLVGDQLTEADVRLWVTLVRFDPVYVGHFKCNLRRIADLPALRAYVQRLYALPAFRDTTRIDEIKQHYYGSHRSLNPRGIVPVGPELFFEESS